MLKKFLGHLFLAGSMMAAHTVDLAPLLEMAKDPQFLHMNPVEPMALLPMPWDGLLVS